MTKDLFLIFGVGDLRIQGYTDSDFMSDIDNRKSTSDFVFLYNDGMISWKSFKQPIIIDSTMEADRCRRWSKINLTHYYVDRVNQDHRHRDQRVEMQVTKQKRKFDS